MAPNRTAPITVVQNDDGPALEIQIFEEPTGTPFDLTNRGAYAVFYESGLPEGEGVVAEIPMEVVNASEGRAVLSWLDGGVGATSYLDRVDPEKPYELQIFTYRNDLITTKVTLEAHYEYFAGDYYHLNEYQTGAPVYKHETEELYISLSTYLPANNIPYIWLLSSFGPMRWLDEGDNLGGESQVKAGMLPSELEVKPIWNYKVELSDVDPDLSHFPAGELDPDPNGILSPEGHTDYNLIKEMEFHYTAYGWSTPSTFEMPLLHTASRTPHSGPATPTYLTSTILPDKEARLGWTVIYSSYEVRTFDPNIPPNSPDHNRLTKWFKNPAASDNQYPARHQQWQSDGGNFGSSSVVDPVSPYLDEDGNIIALPECESTEVVSVPSDSKNYGTLTVLTTIPVVVREAHRSLL